jgi:hypothetical protein
VRGLLDFADEVVRRREVTARILARPALGGWATTALRQQLQRAVAGALFGWASPAVWDRLQARVAAVMSVLAGREGQGPGKEGLPAPPRDGRDRRDFSPGPAAAA